jgi:hypothetical protein
MRRFLILTFSLLIFALFVTVVVWYFVLQNIMSKQPAAPAPAATDMATTTASLDESLEMSIVDDDLTLVSTPKSVPLRDLPLSDEQRSVVGAVGIDVETFVITPEMQSCAAEKLGVERFAEILAGAAPGPLETASLLPCLTS